MRNYCLVFSWYILDSFARRRDRDVSADEPVANHGLGGVYSSTPESSTLITTSNPRAELGSGSKSYAMHHDPPSTTSPLHAEPINAGLPRRLAVRLVYSALTRTPLRRWCKRAGCVVFVSRRLCIKATSFTRLSEAKAMQLVSQHTDVPVPKVHCAFEHKGCVYIVMERIDGKPIGYGWLARSDESRRVLLDKLKSLVQEFRAMPPPTGVGVADVCGGPVFDVRLPSKHLWGPFPSVDDFHRELRNGIEASRVTDPSSVPGLLDLIDFHSRPWPESVFTHGDLSSFNILVKGDEIVGIVDWETAGWLPPYWEYTSSWNVSPLNGFWQAEVGRFIEPMPYELEMETIWRRYFGVF